ncbi:hypothetical protein HOC37_02645 [bacterium]|jgi:hypothetical protein|nr:hypothetical protein [bacterium]MBT3582115.1 hypothetical protein [bacterium]MBT4551866.1 hypothetical protein [bacterium]MBT5988151.1 hypothetical protein [bacterium]MBT7087912.1 hypothetical protein [bacterium]
MYVISGLVLIIAGWLVQYFAKKDNLQMWFVTLYAIGVALLVIDSFLYGTTMIALLNLVSLIVAILVLWKIKGKK